MIKKMMLPANFHNIKSPLMSISLVFMTIFSFIFILLLTFKPDIVLKKDNHGIINPEENTVADPGKCLVGATVTSLLFLLVVWIFSSFK